MAKAPLPWSASRRALDPKPRTVQMVPNLEYSTSSSKHTANVIIHLIMATLIMYTAQLIDSAVLTYCVCVCVCVCMCVFVCMRACLCVSRKRKAKKEEKGKKIKHSSISVPVSRASTLLEEVHPMINQDGSSPHEAYLSQQSKEHSISPKRGPSSSYGNDGSNDEDDDESSVLASAAHV